MKVLPFSKVTLETPLGAEAVRGRLREKLDTREFPLQLDPGRPLRGRVGPTTLHIWSAEWAGGLAVVEGACEAGPPGAVLRLRIRPAWTFLGFAVVMLGLSLGEALVGGRLASTLVVAAMVALVVALLLMLFRRDARKLLGIVVEACALRRGAGMR